MVGYRIKRSELESLILQKSPTWLERAKVRTTENQACGSHLPGRSIWSEIKEVYLRLQGDSKCAFCERSMESATFGRAEMDIEHFRPKGAVVAWSAPPSLNISVVPAPPGAPGYYLLAYDIFNYAACCKPCNSTLKRSCFPVAGKYDFTTPVPEQLLGIEQPLLIYPLGDFDSDPQTLLHFVGTVPAPVAAQGHDRNRALITIEVFRLGDTKGRRNLFRERARVIALLYFAFGYASDPTLGKTAKQAILASVADSAPHANCARSFHRLLLSDPAAAKGLAQAAATFLASKSPGVP